MSIKQKNIKNNLIAVVSDPDYVPRLAFIFGLLLTVLAWFFEFKEQYSFSISGIIQMHKDLKIIFIFEALPFLLYAFTYLAIRILKNKIADFKRNLDQKEKIIDRNAFFAKKIGQGDYSSNNEDIEESDILGQSLLLMRNSLVETSQKESEQNWIADGKDKISNILRLHNDIEDLAYDTLVNLINYIGVIQGAFYVYDDENKKLINVATYAYNRKKYLNQEFLVGEGLIGEAAFEMNTIFRREIPSEYVTITSGILGDEKPSNILIVPLITDESLQGAIEFGSLKNDIDELKIAFLEELSDIIARTIFNINTHKRTEKLLKASQEMTEELRENEEELRQNAEEMRATHEELEKTNTKLEKQIQEVENAQKRIHSLLENASEIISIYSDNKKMIYESPSVTKILGYTAEEMMSGKDFERLTAKGENELNKLFDYVLENPQESYTIQYTYMKKDGKKIYIETTGRNLIHDPAISGIILNSQDITERKRAEKEERMKSKMQALSENSPDMIIRLGIDGQFYYANPIVKIFTGIDNKGVINKKIQEVDFPDVIKEFFLNSIKQTKATEEKQNTEIDFPTNFGNRIMQVNSIPEFNDDKELETILFVAHDITERKNIELEIKEKNRNITESINYAERIQQSILPNTRLIQEYFPNSFIFYIPRDVVSGDFPWFFVKGDYVYIAAVDCTGHGVPGALLSFIGYFLLNNVVDHDNDRTAGQILDEFHQGVRRTLKQDRVDASARDGMDIAFCKINTKTNEMHYAGAHRPLYFVRDGELTEYKGNRKAIGGIPHHKKAEKDFTNYKLKLKENDRIFFFSDGLPDQIGGANKRKYQNVRVREAITGNKEYSMVQYSNHFARDFKKWKGDYKQIDDVLLIGIEF
jgi:PAS domain S-box-containing protein